MKSFARLGSFLDLSGVVAIEYLASLPVRDCASFGPSMPVRSFTKLGVPLFVSDFAHPAMPLPLKNPAALGSTTPLCGFS